MRHPDVEEPARFATAAVPGWKARGWVECDEPPEVNPAIAHRTEPAEPVVKEPSQPAKPATRGKNQEG